MRKIVVVHHPSDWRLDIPNVEVVSSQEYLTNPLYANLRNVRVFNLSRNYWYQSSGYYVSLLGEARGHKVIPSVTTIQDLKSSTLVKTISDDLDELIQRTFAKLKGSKFTFSIYFGRNPNKRYDELAHKLYGLFQAPLLRAQFLFTEKWELQGINAISMKEIPDSHFEVVRDSAQSYFGKKRYDGGRATKALFDLAILVEPGEVSPPSNARAIQKFVDAGERAGFDVDLITKDDYDRLPEYDALLIRETTAVNHYTYRFARMAVAEGMPVMDDPVSILRCSNKVYLQEVLAKANVRTPKTMIVHKKNREQVVEVLGGFPIVLKKPDSSFSQGVSKVDDLPALNRQLDQLLDDSDLVIAQEFLPTDFDWRVGMLGGQPLFGCKYYMAKQHWQIYNWERKTKNRREGDDATLSLDEVPEDVLKAATQAAKLMGNGLYGVDLKQVGKKVYVIEVNDNPNVDAGHEDVVGGDAIYDAVIGHLRAELDKKFGSL